MATPPSLPTIWSREIAKDRALHPMARLIAVAAFARYSDGQGRLYLSRSKAAELTGTTEKQVLLSTRQLLKRGWLMVTLPATPRSAAEYLLRIPEGGAVEKSRRGVRRTPLEGGQENPPEGGHRDTSGGSPEHPSSEFSSESTSERIPPGPDRTRVREGEYAAAARRDPLAATAERNARQAAARPSSHAQSIAELMASASSLPLYKRSTGPRAGRRSP